MAMEVSFCVRKGAWSSEEDDLLRKYVEQYGEGRWYQVPITTGLNRCRKSCRLRWLNYLKPDIKRGDFAADEVDLIMRLHKLLGNRQVNLQPGLRVLFSIAFAVIYQALILYA